MQACEEAIQELGGIVSEVETNLYFVSAGTLLPDDDNDVFATHRYVCSEEVGHTHREWNRSAS